MSTLAAGDREKAEQLYWAWSSFKNQPNEDGTYDGYCGKYRLTITEA